MRERSSVSGRLSQNLRCDDLHRAMVADNRNVIDWPPDAEFVKNTAYAECGLPGEAWDEDGDEGWLCRAHATGDETALPTITLQELLKD